MTRIIRLNPIVIGVGAVVLLSGCPIVVISGATPTGMETDASDGSLETEPTTTAGPFEACADERAAMLSVLDPLCSGCHTEAAMSGFSSVLDPELMVAEGRIKPGDPAGSPIYAKTLNESMPQNAAALTSEQQATLAEYINCLGSAGGNPLASPGCTPNVIISHTDAIKLINEDIFAQDPDDRSNIRYLSLYHLRSAGFCDDVIAVYVQALNKLVNSLSRENQLRSVSAIPGSDGLIFRIDLRHYGWSREIWDAIACENPFAIDFFENAVLDEADAIRDVTLAPIFLQPADAFLRIASRPPFYHEILQIPDNLADFLALEGVDIDAAVDDEVANDQDRVVRAGFAESGVATFNRIVEWYEIKGGNGEYCWISHDFYSNDDFSDIFAHPFDFEDAAREVICSLPNGLQLYLIVNAAGQRLDVADPAIVINVEHEGDAVINGISCMGCHRDGLRDANDEVREHVTQFPENFFSDVLEAVLNLHPPQDVVNTLMGENRQRFAAAMTALGSPHQVAVGNSKFVEPVFLIDLAFDENLELDRVAAELGTTPIKLASIEKLVPDLAKLFMPGGFITREEFAAVFPLAVEALKFGDGKPFAACIDPG